MEYVTFGLFNVRRREERWNLCKRPTEAHITRLGKDRPMSKTPYAKPFD